MSDFLLSCTNQRKQRSRFFYHEAGDPSSRFNVVSPYSYNANNQLIHSPNDFNMRRKSEILKYKTTDYKNNQKLSYSFLAKKIKKNKTCSDSQMSKPTSSSDVPGKIIQLVEDTSVPLYMYKDVTKQFTFQNIPFDNFKRVFDTFSFFNIITTNNTEVGITDIIILNPDNNQFKFNFSIPICIQYEADYTVPVDFNTDIITSQIAIYSSLLDVFYSDSLISSNNIEFRDTDDNSTSDIVNSTLSISLDFAASVNGPVKFTQYVGNIILNNVTLQTVSQYVYSIKLKTNINYAEYTGEIAIDDTQLIEPYRNNEEGSDMINTNSRNVKNVVYGLVTNFNNEDPTLFNSVENCSISLFDGQGEIIEDSARTFTPFSLTSSPV